MTESDLRDRLSEFGYGPDDNLDHLHYLIRPNLHPLTDRQAGQLLVKTAKELDVALVVIDTLSRAHDGDENDSGPIRDMYQATFGPLKSAGVTVLRLDHTGKDATKGQRGSSAKNDDVAVGWLLTAGGVDELKLEAKLARPGFIPPTIRIAKSPENPMHRIAAAQRDAATWDPIVWFKNNTQRDGPMEGWRTAKEAALGMIGAKPNASQIRQAKRRLNKLAESGELERQDGQQGGAGGATPTRWRLAEEQRP